MSSPWRTKKAFLYFGGAFIILLGGAIILLSPYNYIQYRPLEGEFMPFTIKDSPGYYPQFEISVTCHPEDGTEYVLIDFAVRNNETSEVFWMNFTLSSLDMVPDSNPPSYVARMHSDIEPGNYSIAGMRYEGTIIIDVGFTQFSDSRLFIVTGGIMNIVGLFMGMAGYFVAGAFLPTGDDIIVDWGYDEEEDEFKG